MTKDEIQEIYKAGAETNHVNGLRAIFNAGWYIGAGQTPSSTSVDKSVSAAKPAVIVKSKKL